jgi:hypothetical protein
MTMKKKAVVLATVLTLAVGGTVYASEPSNNQLDVNKVTVSASAKQNQTVTRGKTAGLAKLAGKAAQAGRKAWVYGKEAVKANSADLVDAATYLLGTTPSANKGSHQLNKDFIFDN